jgi:hypothetical protein
MKLIRVKLSDSTYTVDAQVDSSQGSNFELRTDRTIAGVHGAAWKPVSSEMYEITVPPSAALQPSPGYYAVQIVVDLGPSR